MAPLRGRHRKGNLPTHRSIATLTWIPAEEILSKFRSDLISQSVRRPKLIQVLSDQSTVINACPEWRDEKYLCISTNDEASATAASDLYVGYISSEKLRVPDPYEISKLERPTATLTKKARSEGLPKEIYNVEDSSKSLLAHEIKSRVWYLPVNLKSIPKRLVTLKMLGQIGNHASCRIVSSEVGVVTVRGDNDHDLTETLEILDDFARVLATRQLQP
ncbi:MAG: hypothetical protein Q9205_003840 [Flavoplaca limonia]